MGRPRKWAGLDGDRRHGGAAAAAGPTPLLAAGEPVAAGRAGLAQGPGRQRAAGRGQFPETRPRGRWARGQSRGQQGCRAGRASGLACLCHSFPLVPWSTERGRVSPRAARPWAVGGPQRPAHPRHSLGGCSRWARRLDPQVRLASPGCGWVRVTGPACHPGSCPLDHRPSLGFTPACRRPVAPPLPFFILAWCPPCWRELRAKDTPSPALPLLASSAAPHPPEGHRRRRGPLSRLRVPGDSQYPPGNISPSGCSSACVYVTREVISMYVGVSVVCLYVPGGRECLCVCVSSGQHPCVDPP